MPSHYTTPYHRRGRGRRRPSKPWYRKKYSAYELAGKAWTTAKYLKGLINVEFGKHDVTFDDATITDTGEVQALTNIIQGDDVTNRHGLSVRGRHIICQGKVTPDSQAMRSTTVMLALVLDKQQPSGNSPTFDQIYAAATPWAFTSITQDGRFKILATTRMAFPVDDKTARNFVLQAPINLKVRWNGPAADNIQKNGLYMIYISDEDMQQPTLDASARFSFTDN